MRRSWSRRRYEPPVVPAMPVVITCPACQRKARVPETAVGKTVKCPGCGTTFTATPDELNPPSAQPPVENELPEPAAELPASARRAERTGLGLLSISQLAFAISLSLQLLSALIAMVSPDPAAKNQALLSVLQVLSLLAILGGLAGTIAALSGSIFCIVPPGSAPARAASATVLVLTVLAIIRESSIPFHAAQQNRFTMLSLGAFEGARQALLAVAAHLHARQLGDAATAKMALFLAFAYPAVVVGLTTLAILVTIFSKGTPHPTFEQVTKIGDLLAQTALVAAGAFVLWRVWDRMQPA